MKIAVLIKQVPGSDSSLPIQSDESWINEESITYVMNESDNYALEEALQLREKMAMVRLLLSVLAQIVFKK